MADNKSSTPCLKCAIAVLVGGATAYWLKRIGYINAKTMYAIWGIGVTAYGVKYYLQVSAPVTNPPVSKDTKAPSTNEDKLKHALDDYTLDMPTGIAGSKLTDDEKKKALIYLESLPAEKQKILVAFADEFEKQMKDFATSPEGSAAISTGDTTGMFKVLANTETTLAKTYGAQPAADFVKFITTFNPKNLPNG